MKGILFLILIFFSSCGTLKLSPQGCLTKAKWGQGYWQDEKKISSSFLVLADMEKKIVDILGEHHLKCEDLKSLRIKTNSIFIVHYTIDIYYTLKN